MSKIRNTAKQRAFIAAFRVTASVSWAAKAARIYRQRHYSWLEADPKYAAEFERVKMETRDLLEDEAVRRAYEGVLEPVTHQGQFIYPETFDPHGFTEHVDAITGEVTYTPGRVVKATEPLAIRKYSDTLLVFLLRGWMPEKYRERSNVKVSEPVCGPIVIEDARLKALTDDELGTLVVLARKIA